MDLEATAREQAYGVWPAGTQTPWDFRNDKWNRIVAEAPDGKRPFKGNITPGKDKLKIHHTPWLPNYTNTKIDTEKAKRWFCDEDEAITAGWHPVTER